eukprot:scaffold5017_cov171-Amphora_coffeaeformis.AAC.8
MFPHLSSLPLSPASLDTETETALMDNLKRVGQGRTTIIIAHRLSTIQDCDEIVVMDQGRVVERGTHDELIHRGGRYTELLHLQETNLLGGVVEGGGDDMKT